MIKEKKLKIFSHFWTHIEHIDNNDKYLSDRQTNKINNRVAKLLIKHNNPSKNDLVKSNKNNYHGKTNIISCYGNKNENILKSKQTLKKQFIEIYEIGKQ